MKKKNVYITVFFIFILTVLAANFDYPKYWGKGADFLNAKLKIQDSKYKIPHFWTKPFKLGLDLQGGIHLLYQADLSGIEKGKEAESMEGLRDVIERRVNLFGVEEPMIQVQKGDNNWRLIVELAGIKDVSQAIKMIGETPYLEFKEQRPQEEAQKIINIQKEVQGKPFEEVQKIPDWQFALEDPYFKSTSLTGKYLKKAEIDFNQTTYNPAISLQFNDEGSKIFEDLTARNVGKPLAIYIDNAIISSPTVQEKISGGKAQITGNFTRQQAQELVRNLNAGALPVPIKLISQQSVGPTLGSISLNKSLKAGMYGFLAVILFMILFYRLAGIIASLALGVYIILFLALFKLIPITLTLAGIAGFILSIGMAVDANVLIFARMREELREGKSFTVSLEEGFRRAWPSVRDGNLTTVIVALILFSLGSGFVKGFALTLTIGTFLSMFSAIFISKNFLEIFRDTKLANKKWLW